MDCVFDVVSDLIE
jgi:hypothetical protein